MQTCSRFCQWYLFVLSTDQRLQCIVLLCFLCFILRCKVHPKKKQQAQKIVNYFDNASDVFWMENKCYCHCRNPLQMKQKKSTHKWKLKWQIIPRVFWSLFFTFIKKNRRKLQTMSRWCLLKKSLLLFQLKLLIFQSSNIFFYS